MFFSNKCSNSFKCTEIGYSLFSGCTSLTNIVIPESVTAIGREAFKNCYSLTSVVIPEGVTVIGFCAFSGCTSLTSIVVEEGNSVYDSRESCNAIIEIATNKLIKGCNSTIIPSSVTEIRKGAFDGCTSLTSIVIPSSVTKIGNNTFGVYDCSFMGCSSLISIVVEEGNSVYDSREGCNAIIETATNKLIQGCNSTIIPSSVTKIEDSAFKGYTSITSLIVAEGNCVYDSREGCNAIIETATNKLIQGCASTIIPSSVTEVGVRAFDGCKSLTNVVIPEGVTMIGEESFSGCTSLTSIEIPSSVTKIDSSAFAGCTSLTSVVINGKIKKLDGCVFRECLNLESITLPAGVNKIDESAFEGCNSLKAINVPAKKYDYYYERIPSPFNSLIVEMEPVKKAKKK